MVNPAAVSVGVRWISSSSRSRSSRMVSTTSRNTNATKAENTQVSQTAAVTWTGRPVRGAGPAWNVPGAG